MLAIVAIVFHVFAFLVGLDGQVALGNTLVSVFQIPEYNLVQAGLLALTPNTGADCKVSINTRRLLPPLRPLTRA